MEPDVSHLMSVASASAELDASELASPGVESVPLHQATGRVLARAVFADRPYPPFDRAMMDGFAARSIDGEAVRRVAGEVAAGRVFDRAMQPGEAVSIMTGAPLPEGADAVMPVEYAERSPDGATVRFTRPLQAGACVAARGSEAPAGREVLPVGRLIGSPEIAVAATVGACELPVFARPTVAVLSTGDEIVPPEGRLERAAQIRDANGSMLAALLSRLGCRVTRVDRCPDTPERLRQAIDAGLSSADVLFVSGGASMGRYDHVPALLSEAGLELRVTKVRIRPGKPFVFARRRAGNGGRFAFGLPGNPVSAFACTLRLADRLLRRMQGLPPEPRWVAARLLEPLASANGPREFCQPAKWDGTGVRPLKWIGSADVFTLVEADALLVRPEADPPRSNGEEVRLLEIPR